MLNRECRRTSDLGLLISRCDASASIAVSMEPPATSTRTSATAKDHVSWVSASTQRRTDQAIDAIHSRRRAPTRSQKCGIDRAGHPGHGDGDGQPGVPAAHRSDENVC